MNPPHQEESKTVAPLEIGVHTGIPLEWSLESPDLYWQCVPCAFPRVVPSQPPLGSPAKRKSLRWDHGAMPLTKTHVKS